jgi:hypothetical protein
MTSKQAAVARRTTTTTTTRAVPVLTKTPVGRRAFVLRLVHDRAVRAGYAARVSKHS